MFFTLVAISLSHETILYHFCNHDAIQRQTSVKEISFDNLRSKTKKSLANERSPIRMCEN